MNTYTITVERQIVEFHDFTIEAHSLEEAQKLALEEAKGDDGGWQFLVVVEEPQLAQEEPA